MTKYYFHLLGPGQTVIRDEDGQDFGSMKAAKMEALETIRDICSEDSLYGTGSTGRYLQISDESGTVLASVPYSAAA